MSELFNSFETRPYQLMTTNLLTCLALLYRADEAPLLLVRVEKLIADYRLRIPARSGKLTERDSFLITYGDPMQLPDEKSLQSVVGNISRLLLSQNGEHWLRKIRYYRA